MWTLQIDWVIWNFIHENVHFLPSPSFSLNCSLPNIKSSNFLCSFPRRDDQKSKVNRQKIIYNSKITLRAIGRGWREGIQNLNLLYIIYLNYTYSLIFSLPISSIFFISTFIWFLLFILLLSQLLCTLCFINCVFTLTLSISQSISYYFLSFVILLPLYSFWIPILTNSSKKRSSRNE